MREVDEIEVFVIVDVSHHESICIAIVNINHPVLVVIFTHNQSKITSEIDAKAF